MIYSENIINLLNKGQLSDHTADINLTVLSRFGAQSATGITFKDKVINDDFKLPMMIIAIGLLTSNIRVEIPITQIVIFR